MPSKIEKLVKKLQESGKLSKGLLLSQQELEIVKKSFDQPHLIKRKRDENIPYSVIKEASNQHFIVHTGEEKEVAKGAQGLLKLAQNCATGELCLVKIIKSSNEQEYKKKEARKEADFLKRKGLILGFQERTNDKGEYKIYTFIKILPGVIFCNPNYPPDKTSETLVKYAAKFDKIDQCNLLLNLLLKLDELKKEGIIHRDLHGGNILVDPTTLEPNIIDFGLALDADENGFCIAKDVRDTKELGPNFRFANGFDIISLGNYLPLVIKDKQLQEIYKKLEKSSAASQTEFNAVSIDSAIKEVQSYLTNLKDTNTKKDNPRM